MSLAQKITVALLSFLIFITTIIGGIASVMSLTLTNRDTVRQTLTTQTIHELASESLQTLPATKVALEGGDGPTQNTGFDPVILTKIIEKYFNFNFYTQALGQIINGVYDWLEGLSARPEFKIALTNDPAGFRDFLITTITERYRGLPLCANQDPADFNPLAANCRLRSLNENQLKKLITQQLTDSQLEDVFSGAAVSSAELMPNFDQTNSQQLQNWFGFFKKLPWIVFGVWLGLLGLLAVSLGKRPKLKTLGINLLAPAALLAIIGAVGWGFRSLIIRVLSPLEGINRASALSRLASEIANSLYGRLSIRILMLAGILLLIGTVLLILARHSKLAAQNKAT